MEFSTSFPGSLSPSRSAGTRGPWKRGCGISALVSRAGKPVEASRNVCCFLRLHVIYLRYLPCSIHSIPVTRVHSNSPVDDINRIRAKVVLKLHK